MDKVFLWIGTRVRIQAADYYDVIHEDRCDALINFIYPHNKDKLGIFATAGEKVVQEYEEKKNSDDSVVKKGVVITSAGNLPHHRKIFHIQVDFRPLSGPVRTGFQGHVKFRYAVMTALKMADKEEMKSICIPDCEGHSVAQLGTFQRDIFDFEKSVNPLCMHLIVLHKDMVQGDYFGLSESVEYDSGSDDEFDSEESA